MASKPSTLASAAKPKFEPKPRSAVMPKKDQPAQREAEAQTKARSPPSAAATPAEKKDDFPSLGGLNPVTPKPSQMSASYASMAKKVGEAKVTPARKSTAGEIPDASPQTVEKKRRESESGGQVKGRESVRSLDL